jgi:N-acetylglucosaminyldiphosphoundecaprenol N-acetyl-beta-D-mannosaminyltransferase
MSLAQIDRFGLLDHLFDSLARGRGGWLITANLDFLRRHAREPAFRALYDAADIRVADGMPLVWAARLQGDWLPERVAGSSLVWLIAERAAREGRSLYLLGGEPGANRRASDVFREKFPGIRVIGASSPRIGSPPTAAEVEGIRAEMLRVRPDILLVGLGSPKQEELIRALRPALPATWMIGVGISFSFVSGDVRRAPGWMRRAGLEWVHRMAQEPGRLARRYLVHNLPFAFRLFGHAVKHRLQTHGTRGAPGVPPADPRPPAPAASNGQRAAAQPGAERPPVQPSPPGGE